MRTTQTAVRLKTARHFHSASRHRPVFLSGKNTTVAGFSILFSLLFLLGYIPGIMLGRLNSVDEGLGNLLADYYTELSGLNSWGSLFATQLSAAFLQLLFVALCGFSAIGLGFLILFFLARGIFLGYSASSVLVQGGMSALGQYWITTCLFNALLLLVLLWLAGHAVQVSQGLFQSVFLGGAPRGQLHANTRRLGVRYCVALLFSALLGMLCSGLATFFLHIFR